MDSTKEEIYLLMAFDSELQKREAEKMQKMFGAG
jgi:hypothetical protein